MYDVKNMALFVREELTGCRFVGISDDGELFVEYDHEDPDQVGDAAKIIARFPEVGIVIGSVQPSIEQLTKMVNDLNAVSGCDKTKTVYKSTLLKIGKF